MKENKPDLKYDSELPSRVSSLAFVCGQMMGALMTAQMQKYLDKKGFDHEKQSQLVTSLKSLTQVFYQND